MEPSTSRYRYRAHGSAHSLEPCHDTNILAIPVQDVIFRLTMRLILSLLVAAAAASCAGRPNLVAAPTTIDLAPADTLFEAGCYRCLKEAFDIYGAGVRSFPSPPRARERAFVTAALLAVREKEIGLEAAPWLERAAALATPDERVYLDIVSSLLWTTAGAAPDFSPASRPSAATRTEWRAFLERSMQSSATSADGVSGRDSVLDQYLLLAVICTTGTQRLDRDTEQRIETNRPILRYRLGLCSLNQRSHLEAVLAADSRFIETSFFIGRYEMTAGVTPTAGGRRSRRAWLSTAVPPLSAAHEGLPEAPVVSTVLAGLMRSRGELARALTLYDEALALRPTQRDALLGRTITLSYLARRDEAITSATRLIELGTWYVGTAYYWRALNHYHKADLESAARDIANAKRLEVTDDVMALSGTIAYEQKRLADARADFDMAIQLNPNRCTAHWSLGILNVDEEMWSPAVARFSRAGTCFQAAADLLRGEIDELPTDLPKEVLQQQVASVERSIATSLTHAGRSFSNAAQASLRMGDKASAVAHARSARAYAEMKERAESLARSLEP